MKIPARMRKYCPNCREHTIHRVRKVRSGKRRGLAEGQRRARREKKGYGNKGRYSKPAVSQWKMRSKTTQKVDLLLTCTKCEKSRHKSLDRVRKVEIVK